jgi:hypothetical protein
MIGGRDSRREAAQSSGYEPEPDDDDAAANEQLATAERVARRQKRKSWLGRVVDRMRRR